MTQVVANAGPRLRELEAVIDRGKSVFVKVGLALQEIRDRRLYKERGYRNFDDYTREHLGFQRAYAHRLIQGAAAVQEVSPNGDTFAPVNEAQARVLAQIPQGERVGAMEQAHEIATERSQPVTAAIIREVYEGATAEVPAEPIAQTKCPHCNGTGWIS